MRDGDRERRAERVEAGKQAHVAGHGQAEGHDRRGDDRDVRGRAALPELPKPARHLAVHRQGVTCRESPSIEVVAAQNSTAGAITTTITSSPVESQLGS